MSHEAKSGGSLPPFIALYAVLYCSFGAASPFMPSFIASRGILPEQIGLIFAAATAIRLISAPLVGRIADQTQSLRLTLAVCAIASAGVGAAYLLVSAFWAILAVALLHAITLAPLTNLADALALLVSRTEKPGRFEYGWIRGAGSAAFIAGSFMGGTMVAAYGLESVISIQSILLLGVPLAAFIIARPQPTTTITSRQPNNGVLTLLRVRDFRRVVLIAALVLGSHAMHDTFAVIRWSAAGISPRAVTVLWSMAVASEVVVFFVLGPWLLKAITPACAIALAACAGALRWTVAALTADAYALALIQPLHGFTFALFHLATMRLLARIVPGDLAATGLALYGTVGAGISGAAVTLVSGWLYTWMGPAAFLIMGLLCAASLPLIYALRANWADPVERTAPIR